ncbi:hypothetical protein SSS_10211 [Sarcoptes scabiei]|nr:hypothetical protein SSS_10211 [Sarcoptes scabiei]
MELADDISSQSSFDSYSYEISTRFHQINSNNHEDRIQSKQNQIQTMKEGNFGNFHQRLISRRKIKSIASTSSTSSRYPDDDDKTDNSLDSATMKAHEEILRNANLLKQERVISNDNSGYMKKTYHHHHHYISKSPELRMKQDHQAGTRINQHSNVKDETRLLNEFDAILNLEESKLSNFGDDVFHSIPNNNNNSNSASNTKTISRSSTENFSNETDKPKSSASPRFRRKNQVLKAATSIPSLIFSNKNFKQKPSTSNLAVVDTNIEYEINQQEKYLQEDSLSKKNSIDDDVFGITATKARRSPLRILGNLVDDKIFRGRWSTAKRAKSTDEITWALAQEEKNLLQQNNGPNRPRSVNSKQARKKSLGGFLSAPSTDMNNNFFSIKKTPSKNKLEKFKNNSDSNSEISINQSVYPVNKTTKFKFMEITRRKPSNSSYTETFNVSDSSINSVTERKPIRRKIISNVWPSSAPSDRHQDSSTSITMKNTSKNLNQGIIQRNEIKAETLAEIEAFEKMLESHLQED